MNKITSMACAIALMSACVQVAPETQAINDAAAALGGKDRIQSAKTLTIEGEGASPNVGQNTMPDGELPVWKVTEYKRVIDLANGRTRMQQKRTAQFLFAGALVQQQHQGLDGDVPFNVSADGTATRAGEAAVTDRRMEMLHHPIVIVRAALDPAAKVANLRTQGNETLVDITTAKGEALTLAIDAASKLPLRVSSSAYNANMGDVTIATTFASYEDVAGLKMPKRLTTNIDRYLQFGMEVSKNSVDGEAGDIAAPDAVKAAAPPPPPRWPSPPSRWARGSGGWRAPATIGASCSSSTITSRCMKCR